jgi:hypothetical protein
MGRYRAAPVTKLRLLGFFGSAAAPNSASG